MKQIVLSLLAAAPILFGQTQTFTYTYSGLPVPIYPDDWNTVAVATIFVPRSILITKVTASVQVQYSGVGDLNVYMWSPVGTRTRLLERNCGSLQNIDTTFDDAASGRYSDFCPAEPGRGPFRGNEPLSNWNNENAFGSWRFGVENNGSDSRTGTLSGFSITITGTPVGTPTIGPNSIVSLSNLLNGTVAPGDQVAVLGVNLGPVGGARADATRALPTTLSGTSVMFGDTAAPIFFVSDRLVVVHAPTNLAPGTTTQIQVRATSGTSRTVPLEVVAVKPGILTYEAGGVGQAKATNENGTPNGDSTISASAQGAVPGSIVAVYATGLGPLDPPVPQGTPAPTTSVSVATTPIAASIAGLRAQVTYAGTAPGMIGTYQVNVRVPVGTPAGKVRLVLTADGIASQAGVTILIR